MDKKFAKRLYNECRDWSSIQDIMTEKEYQEFLRTLREED